MDLEIEKKLIKIVQKHSDISKKNKNTIVKSFEILCLLLNVNLEDIVQKGLFEQLILLLDASRTINKFNSVSSNFTEIVREFNGKLERRVDEEFLRCFDAVLDWDTVSRCQELSEQFMDDYANKLNWFSIVEMQVLSESFIEKHLSDIKDIYHVIDYQRVSEDFLRKHKDELVDSWQRVVEKQVLSESFLEEILYYPGILEEIFAYQKVSEAFIRKHHNNKAVNWNYISIHQVLSESFIDEFADRVDWWSISTYQKLSESFIEKHIDKVNWARINYCQKLSEEFRNKWSNFLPMVWERATKENKLAFLKRISCYEIVNDEYVVAYQAVRNNYTLVNNHRMMYEVGKEYESNCNCNVYDISSVGLYVGTKANALSNFSYGRLLKIHVDINDIGVVLSDQRIRAKKIKVVSDETEINHV